MATIYAVGLLRPIDLTRHARRSVNAVTLYRHRFALVWRDTTPTRCSKFGRFSISTHGNGANVNWMAAERYMLTVVVRVTCVYRSLSPVSAMRRCDALRVNDVFHKPGKCMHNGMER